MTTIDAHLPAPRRCIVHFGMPKTGSTSIQASLLAAGDLPEARYLNAGEKNSGRVLATLFLQDPRDFHLNRKWDFSREELEAERRQALATFAEQFRSPTHRLFILSGEAISSMAEDTLRRMRDWLLTHVDEVQAVGYVRRPWGYMESELQQKIKAGRGRFDLASHYPGYRDRFTPIENVFGRDQVRYWLFDPAGFPQNDVVRDFAARLGLSLPDAAIQRANESLSLDGARLLYLYRKLGTGYGRGAGVVEENRRLNRRLREAPGPKLRIARSAALAVLAQQAEDMAWMQSRLDGPLDETRPDTDAPAVAQESDLMCPSAEALAWLAQQLDRPAPGDLPPQSVADWVHALRLRLSGEAAPIPPPPPRAEPDDQAPPDAMDLSQLANAVRARLAPSRTVAPADLEAAISAMLGALRGLLAEPSHATRQVAGLGSFRPRRPGRSAGRARPAALIFEPDPP